MIVAVEKYVFLNCYRPPGPIKAPFWKHLEQNLIALTAQYPKRELFLVGDLNIDLLDQNAPDVKKLNDLMSSLGLNQLVTEPTRITQNTSTLIDHVWTSNNDVTPCSYSDQDHSV